MVGVFVLALLHVINIPSDVSANIILRSYILGLSALGLAVGFYRAFLRPVMKSDSAFEVKEVRRLNKDIVEVEMTPLGAPLVFEPGQFVFVKFTGRAIKPEAHPFSVTAAHGERDLKLVIKALGDFTAGLDRLKPGDRASVEGPFGKFTCRRAGAEQIWIAGGGGITPFLSMARSSLPESVKIDLYYCVRKMEETVFLSELESIGNIRTMPWYSDEKGRIDAKAILDSSGKLDGKDIFLCGPDDFMANLRDQFRTMGVPSKRIYWERFKLI